MSYELNIGKKALDDLFKDDKGRKTEEIFPVDIKELKPYAEQPFKVLLDSSMDELCESIKDVGVLSPIIARPHKEGGYEILSGHRRVKACELLDIEEIPVVVKNLDDDAAVILLVDSNLQRENILPSEKAFAYQLKLEAMKHQGKSLDLTSRQIVGKLESADIVGLNAGESGRQIQRYIRLTNLIDPILQMVDNKKIAFNAAVEISYLGSLEQAKLYEMIEQEQTAPSIEQAKKLHHFSHLGKLNEYVIESIMMEQKPERFKISLTDEQIKKYFPRSYTKKQIEDTILKLVAGWHRRRMQDRER